MKNFVLSRVHKRCLWFRQSRLDLDSLNYVKLITFIFRQSERFHCEIFDTNRYMSEMGTKPMFFFF